MISAKDLKSIIYVFATIVRLEDLDLALILRGHHTVKVLKNRKTSPLFWRGAIQVMRVHLSINVTKLRAPNNVGIQVPPNIEVNSHKGHSIFIITRKIGNTMTFFQLTNFTLEVRVINM